MVKLKSGEIIIGEVIVENDGFIIVRVKDKGFSRSIVKENISEIRKTPPPLKKPVTEKRAYRKPSSGPEEFDLKKETDEDAQSSRRYSIKDLGMVIVGPIGWLKHLAPPIEGVLVLFNTSESPKRIFPGIAVSVDDIGQKGRTIYDFAEKAFNEQKESGNTVIEPIKEMIIAGTKGLRFTTQSEPGKEGFSFTFLHCFVQKENKVVSIMCVAKTDEFENYLEDFAQSIESVRIQ